MGNVHLLFILTSHWCFLDLWTFELHMFFLLFQQWLFLINDTTKSTSNCWWKGQAKRFCYEQLVPVFHQQSPRLGIYPVANKSSELHPASVRTVSPSSKYEHRRASALLRNIQNMRICMGKKPIVSVTYENERISIKNSLPYLKCVLHLSCVVHGPIYGRFMSFYLNGFLSI